MDASRSMVTVLLWMSVRLVTYPLASYPKSIV